MGLGNVLSRKLEVIRSGVSGLGTPWDLKVILPPPPTVGMKRLLNAPGFYVGSVSYHRYDDSLICERFLNRSEGSWWTDTPKPSDGYVSQIPLSVYGRRLGSLSVVGSVPRGWFLYGPGLYLQVLVSIRRRNVSVVPPLLRVSIRRLRDVRESVRQDERK